MVYVFNALNTSAVNDGQGDGLRTAMTKVNSMLQELMVTRALVTTGVSNLVYSTPSSGTGYPSLRALVNSDLPTSSVVATSYGTTSLIPRITVNSKGIITSVTEFTITSQAYRDIDVGYVDTSTVKIVAGSYCKNSTNIYHMATTVDIEVDLEVAGAGGLDTGVEAAAWYYLYMIATTAGVISGVLSQTDESTTGTITLPAGYTYKRQVPIAIRNGSSQAGNTNIIPFTYSPRTGLVWYTTARNSQNPPTNATGIDLASVTNCPTYFGNCTTGANANYVTCGTASLFIPPMSTQAEVEVNPVTGNVLYYRGVGSTQQYIKYFAGGVAHEPIKIYVPQQLIEAGNQASQVHWGFVYGYYVTKRIP